MSITIQELRTRINKNSSDAVKQLTGMCSIRQMFKNGHGSTIVLRKTLVFLNNIVINNITIDMNKLDYAIIIFGNKSNLKLTNTVFINIPNKNKITEV